MSMTPISASQAETNRRIGVLRGEIIALVSQAAQSVPHLITDDIENVVQACRQGIHDVVLLERAAIAAQAQVYFSGRPSPESLHDIARGAIVREDPQFVSHAEKIAAGVFSPDDPKPPSMFDKALGA